MSIGKWIWLLVFVVVIGWLSSVKYKNVKKEKAKAEMQAKAKTAQQVMGVTGYIAEYSKLSNSINTIGTVIAADEVDLQPETSGRIVFLQINEGGFVSKGTLLAKIKDTELQAQLKKLKAQHTIAVSNEKRLAELLRINGVAQQEYDLALNTLNNIEADMDLLKAQIDKTEIRAPFSGKLGLRNISMGAYVSPSTIITSLQNLSQLKMDITIPEKYSSVVEVGNKMQCSVEGILQPFLAKISAIQPQIDEDTRNLKVRAIIENPDRKLVPGAFVKVQLKLADINNAVMIPANAIIPDGKSKKVIIADSSRAKFVLVETGLRLENEVQILNGIKVGDTVLTSGILQVKPNAAVRFTQVTKKSDIQ